MLTNMEKTSSLKPKTKLVQGRLSCPRCPSSDAFHIYSDGHGYCFSCNHYCPDATQYLTESPLLSLDPPDFNPPDVSLKDDVGSSFQFVPWRSVTKQTFESYGVKTKVDAFGEPQEIIFPYSSTASKTRKLKTKTFYSTGEMSEASLFGQEKFSAGEAKAITITEGELDALSVYQMLGSQYPCVSVRSASSAKKDCANQRDYLNSFEKIYLCFDNDEPGRTAKAEVARLFDFNKVYDVQLTEFKDANDYLTNGKQEAFKRIWWNARRFLPEDIVSTFAEFDAIIDAKAKEQAADFPFKQMNEMTYGVRTGEVVLFTAMEGIGKTEIIRAIEYHLLKTTDANIGIIHLEEDKTRFLKGLAGYVHEMPCHLPDSPISPEQIKDAIHSLVKNEDRLHIYNHFGSDDPKIILDMIRFMVASCNCKFIFFDHITMAVSGLAEDDERKALDFISTRLAMMVKELDFTLFLVSHVNDNGQTRGSRNISKIADCWIHLDRNKLAEEEDQRNTTYLSFNKNRFGARTGPGGRLRFDLSSFTIKEIDPGSFDLPPLEPIP